MESEGAKIIPIYSQVRLLTDKYLDEGVGIGAVGYIIETFDDVAYEVEFSDEGGITLAQITATGSELEACEPTAGQ